MERGAFGHLSQFGLGQAVLGLHPLAGVGRIHILQPAIGISDQRAVIIVDLIDGVCGWILHRHRGRGNGPGQNCQRQTGCGHSDSP